MDREQHELQNLGFFKILKQTFKLIFKRAKIFSIITLSLIVPLSILYLTEYYISRLIFGVSVAGNGSFRSGQNRSAGYWIFVLAYNLILVLLSLTSISAIVFTVASIFSSRPISSVAALRSVPKAWGKLAVTVVFGIFAIVVYSAIAIALIAVCIAVVGTAAIGGIILLIIVLVLYLAGLAYLVAVWYLAAVVSVLEPAYGFSAVKRGFKLIRGKIFVSGFLAVLIGVFLVGAEFLFAIFVVAYEGEQGLGVQIPVAIMSVLIFAAALLIGIVAGTVLYFVCKSYHHENIDVNLLSDHLQGYLGNYVVLDKTYPNHNNNVQRSQNV